MALPTSGKIAHSDIKAEFGGTGAVGLTNYYGADTGVPNSGTIKESDFYGKSSAPPVEDVVEIDPTKAIWIAHTINSGYPGQSGNFPYYTVHYFNKHNTATPNPWLNVPFDPGESWSTGQENMHESQQTAVGGYESHLELNLAEMISVNNWGTQYNNHYLKVTWVKGYCSITSNVQNLGQDNRSGHTGYLTSNGAFREAKIYEGGYGLAGYYNGAGPYKSHMSGADKEIRSEHTVAQYLASSRGFRLVIKCDNPSRWVASNKMSDSLNGIVVSFTNVRGPYTG